MAVAISNGDLSTRFKENHGMQGFMFLSENKKYYFARVDKKKMDSKHGFLTN